MTGISQLNYLLLVFGPFRQASVFSFSRNNISRSLRQASCIFGSCMDLASVLCEYSPLTSYRVGVFTACSRHRGTANVTTSTWNNPDSLASLCTAWTSFCWHLYTIHVSFLIVSRCLGSLRSCTRSPGAILQARLRVAEDHTLAPTASSQCSERP